MSVKAHGTWSVQDFNGKRTFDPTPADIKVGDLVRVMGYGYGARKDDAGREGLVVAVRESRVQVEFANGTTRIIGGACLGILRQPVLTPQGYGNGEDTIDLHACWTLDDASLARAIKILTHEQARRAAAATTTEKG